VYALLLEDLRRRVDSMTTAAAIAAVMGSDVTLPDWFDVRERFDADLCAPPDHQRPEYQTPEAIQLRALGLR
jgi:hypothetical protein